MKNVELRLLSELMKNSRRSDRELAKLIGTSQPTITRTRNKLEKEGYIEEYTMIPNFEKLGFQLMAIVLIKFTRHLSVEEIQNIRKSAEEIEQNLTNTAIIVVDGAGSLYDRIVVSFHENLESYLELLSRAGRVPHADSFKIETILISLVGQNHYRLLSLSALARHLARLERKKLSERKKNEKRNRDLS